MTFSCVNGEKVFVRFNNNSAVLTRYGTAIELQQERSASGFVYTNGPNTIRGQGDDLTIEVGRMFPIQCKAVNNHLSSR